MTKLFLLPVMITLFAVDPGTISSPASDTYARKRHLENGVYTAYHENGNMKFYMVYKKNKITGEWRSWYPSGSACDSGRFSGNNPDGVWKGWYPDGSPRYIWHLSASKLVRVKDELLRQPKTKFFAISNKPVSEAVKYYQADHLFDQPVSRPRITLRSHLVHAKSYDLHSIEKKVNSNTVHEKTDYVPPFPEMLLHGEFTSFYPGGLIKEEGIYINGLREGVWDEYSLEGEKSRGSYRHGYKSGEWRKYDKNGKLKSYKHYKPNGDVSEEHDFQTFRRY